MFLINLFQKIKWNILARLNSIYYIYSNIGDRNEKKFRESGLLDFKRLVLDDKTLKKEIDFKKSKVWEIGCGNGRMTEFFAEYFREIIATDISSTMIKLTKKRLSRYKNLSIEEKDLFDINLVFSYAVFQHFPTKKMVIKKFIKIYKVLKKDGIAKIQIRGVPLKSRIKWIKWYYGVSFQKEEICKIVEKIGFKTLNIQGDNTKCLWLTLKK